MIATTITLSPLAALGWMLGILVLGVVIGAQTAEQDDE
jgi:hypothetical protein